ncbi:multiple epidermal growth factor-like domains protein 11 [Mya arenaria]|uniref:multiple epidermal growth factor-like domains protein 11 n=1 Tax=Mya arenaria TaxID=6604 RepID=UPI0022E29FF9|nr:multiple epidermal growth factor-like domains protein 11 [Mya arenaria]
MGICYTVMVLNMIFIQVQGIQQECKDCGCCKQVKDVCYYPVGCINGCIDGYWGVWCYNKCQNLSCKTCDRDDGFNCYECKTGFYDKDCGSSCSPNCKGCRRNDGQCNSCVNGYWGKFCNNQCGYQCKTCSRLEGCIPKECQDCGCCKQVKEICYHPGGCTNGCIDGYWGVWCYNKCQNLNCKTCDRDDGFNCYECKTGFYDKDCGSSCSPNCKGCQMRDGCQGSICRKNDGSCLNCKPGYFGQHCNKPCPEFCQSCEQNGLCSTCKPGYLNTNKRCTCRTNICDNSVNCNPTTEHFVLKQLDSVYSAAFLDTREHSVLRVKNRQYPQQYLEGFSMEELQGS